MSSLNLIGAIFVALFFLSVLCPSSCTYSSLSKDKSLQACGDSSWFLYKDEKCWKLIDQLVTQEEAKQICLTQSGVLSSDPLLTIRSQEEKSAVEQLLFEQLGLVDNVWLGAERKSKVEAPLEFQFEWSDGSPLNYSNWAVGNPTNDTEKNCSVITSHLSRNGERSQEQNYMNGKSGSGDGLWEESSCLKRYLVFCHKPQSWSLSELQNAFLILREQHNLLQDSHNFLQDSHNLVQAKADQLEKNPVPVGFIYVELSGQPEPSVIWPNVQWTQVTSQYGGLFFRAEGGGSAAFGQIQEDATRQVTRVDFTHGETALGGWYTDLPKSGWSSWVLSGVHWGGGWYEHLRFHTSDTEIRPINSAVRIWKRTA